MLNAGQDLKNFIHQIYSVFVPFFSKPINKAKYSIYEKLSTVFSVACFRSEEKSAALKALELGNLFELFRLVNTFAREVCHLGLNLKKNMTIVLFFSLSPEWQTARAISH